MLNIITYNLPGYNLMQFKKLTLLKFDFLALLLESVLLEVNTDPSLSGDR